MYKDFDTEAILVQIKEVGVIFSAEFRQNPIPQTRQEFMDGLRSIEERSLYELRQRIDLT
jgi:hypothetical protein